MASVEQLLLSKVLEDGSLDEAARLGLKPIHFSGDWERVYGWVLEYEREHGHIPTERALHRQFGDVSIVSTTGESLSGLTSELLDAYRLRELSSSVADVIPLLNDGDAAGAVEHLRKGIQKASVDAMRLRDVNMIDSWLERYEKYEQMRNTPNALRGIPTGFYGLDRITHGLRPQQFVVLAGEPKRGKSLFALIIANACHTYGKVPLFVSFEMSIEEQAARYDALASRVSYDSILSGELTTMEMSRIKKNMLLRKNMQPFIFSEDTSSLTTVSALAAKVQEYKPDELIVDGMYLMDDEEGEPKGSPQALTNISRGLKRLAQKFDIPLLGTTQVLSWKLSNKRTRAITGDSIGYTSAFLQDTDLLLGVERNPDIDDQSIIRVVEARTASRGEVHVNWDWNTMGFEEVTYDDEIDPAFD
jgi:archaellum biogenesis ATPase FlaH